MTYRYLTDLADVARGAGLKVVESPGWKTRGRPSSTGGFNPVGVLCHHTATSKASSDKNVVSLLVNGRSDLPGPLCHLGLGRDGTVYVIAAGRANHAGKAKSSGTVAAGDGNSLYIGIEAFNDGRGEKWPEAQYVAYVKLAAALCEHVTGNSAETVRGHKEASVTGKIDPTFDMGTFRAHVARALEASKPKPSKPKPAPRRSVRVATINLPFGTDTHKRRLLAPVKRASAAIGFLNRKHVDLVTFQELASPSAATIRLRHRRWQLITARPNNVFPRRSISNAIAIRRRVFAVDRRENMRVEMPGRRRGLNMLVLTVRHRATGERLTVIGVHNPRRKTDAATNQRARDLQVARAKRARANGERVLLMGDFNDGSTARALRDEGLSVGAHHGVDVIAGLGVTFDRSQFAPVPFSDHAAVMADVNLKEK